MSSTYGDSSEQSLRHVSHNDTNEEDDSIEPVISQDEGDDEEGHSEENGHSSDDMDEMGNLFGNGSVTWSRNIDAFIVHIPTSASVGHVIVVPSYELVLPNYSE